MRTALAAMLLLFAQASYAQFYWRADIGWSWPGEAGIRDKDFATDGLICGDAACTVAGELDDVNGSLLLGLGFGWRVSPNVRADLRVDYRGGYELDDTDAFPSDFKADIRSLSVMINAYFDFGRGAVRPYVGAGIGAASNKIDSLVNSGGALGPVTFSAPGKKSSDRAWALMAGIGFSLSQTTALDLGYRYVDLGRIESDAGTLTCSPACPGATYSGLSGKLRAHEITLGARF